MGAVCSAAKEHGNTLGVAPTGFGKSVAMAAIVARLLRKEKRALILQHRIELVTQNRERLYAFDKKIKSSEFTAKAHSWRGSAVFAMVQSLHGHLDQVPNDIGLVLVDEAHHAPARTYGEVFEAVAERSGKFHLVGVTATPERADGKGLGGVFTNCADQVELVELIKAGNLVKPRTYVIDLGVQDELRALAPRRTAADYDMDEVAAIMDRQLLNDSIVKKWKELAQGRRTVAFAATVEHAVHVCEAFRLEGVNAAVVHGGMSAGARAKVLADLDSGRLEVVVNVAVLTEGFDSPPVSCVLLLRPSSHRSTMTQMIGRGLRTIDPERYPGVHKSDCVVIDFGISVLTHGSLEQEVNLSKPRPPGEDAGPKKLCPKCRGKVPIQSRECPLCGYEFIIEAPDQPLGILEDFTLNEIELIEHSPFKWEHFWEGSMHCCSAMGAWAIVLFYRGEWHAFGGLTTEAGRREMHYLTCADHIVALAAGDDHMREHGDRKVSRKSKRWLNEPASEKQLKQLGMNPMLTFGLSRYRASCEITWKFNETRIRRHLESLK